MRLRPFATIIVGPSAPIREGLSRTLSAADFPIVASARCIYDLALCSLAPGHSTLLVIDAAADPKAAIEQIGHFKQRLPAARIAVLVDYYQPDEIISAFRAGANAYCEKSMMGAAFVKLLELVMLGETIVPSAILPAILRVDDNDCEPMECIVAIK